MDFNELHTLLHHIGIIPKALSKHEAWQLFINSMHLNPFTVMPALSDAPTTPDVSVSSSAQHDVHQKRLSVDEHGRGKTGATDDSAEVSGEMTFRMYADYMYKLLVYLGFDLLMDRERLAMERELQKQRLRDTTLYEYSYRQRAVKLSMLEVQERLQASEKAMAATGPSLAAFALPTVHKTPTPGSGQRRRLLDSPQAEDGGAGLGGIAEHGHEEPHQLAMPSVTSVTYNMASVTSITGTVPGGGEEAKSEQVLVVSLDSSLDSAGLAGGGKKKKKKKGKGKGKVKRHGFVGEWDGIDEDTLAEWGATQRVMEGARRMTKNQHSALQAKFFGVWRGNVADFFGDVLRTATRHADFLKNCAETGVPHRDHRPPNRPWIPFLPRPTLPTEGHLVPLLPPVAIYHRESPDLVSSEVPAGGQSALHFAARQLGGFG